ncbi:PH domain-containing protein [Sphingomicrobium lutaoense]|uniref:Putative membrane protein n=1 Tax=Sphingomicrobium lutaoense TaxID=515949 RepID=A0A839Z0I9_9SPHN|nr:PH domain-containing protein [Sphingomicrobium lutaoense]MBB3763075.1 putative membrane protein [Sphingomicrobium lutaoense]
MSEAAEAIMEEEMPAPERLHPLTMLTGLGGILKSLWGAIAASAFLLYSGNQTIAIAVIGFALLSGFIQPLLRYLSFSFLVEEDEIVMNSGILNRNHRSVPFDRVQDVNIEQNPIARVFGLARVKLETGASAGKGEEDGIIDSIALDRANELRDRIRRHRAAALPALPDRGEAMESEQARPAVFAMDARRVFLAGMFNFSLAVVGALFGLMQTLGDVANFNFFSRTFWQESFAPDNPLVIFILANQIMAVIAGLVSLVLVGLATGIIGTALREWNFRLDRTESGFRRRRGLLTLTDTVLPLKRVQAAIYLDGPVKRHYGWTSLKLQSLAQDSGNSGDHVVAPLARPDETKEILAAMDWRPLPEDAEDWHRPSPALAMEGLLSLLPLFIGGIVLLFFHWSGLLVIGAATLLSIGALLDWRWRRHRVDRDRVLIRSGWWQKRLVILPLAKIQSADLRRNFIDRWFGIASVRLGVAGGKGFSAHGVSGLATADAFRLRQRLLEGSV